MESSPNDGSSSQGLGQNGSTSQRVATGTSKDNPSLEDNEINHLTNNSGNLEKEQEEESSHFKCKKRKQTSPVWLEFKKIKLPDGTEKASVNIVRANFLYLQADVLLTLEGT